MNGINDLRVSKRCLSVDKMISKLDLKFNFKLTKERFKTNTTHNKSEIFDPTVYRDQRQPFRRTINSGIFLRQRAFWTGQANEQSNQGSAREVAAYGEMQVEVDRLVLTLIGCG